MEMVNYLYNLGLNEKEAQVYLALLQLGKSTAYSVSKMSGLKKSTTYVILDQLSEKGFANKIPKSKKRLYKAESPDKCLELVKEKLNLTQEKLPELLAMKKKNEEKVSISYYEGIIGIKEMHEKFFKVMRSRKIENRKYVAFLAHEKGIPQELLDYFKEVNELHKKYKIQRKSITVYHPTIVEKYLSSKDLIESLYFQAKAISSKKYSSNVSIIIYDKYVQIFSHRYVQAVLIENPDVANSLKQIFYMVWNLVDKDKKNYLCFNSNDKKNNKKLKKKNKAPKK
ncbi:MAG: hypothetical protein GF335_00355 [Candidatus Moranbacteria bacterium]|nr:hypothetical protein [Candidatus Moranbacteria bacterium]